MKTYIIIILIICIIFYINAGINAIKDKDPLAVILIAFLASATALALVAILTIDFTNPNLIA